VLLRPPARALLRNQSATQTAGRRSRPPLTNHPPLPTLLPCAASSRNAGHVPSQDLARVGATNTANFSRRCGAIFADKGAALTQLARTAACMPGVGWSSPPAATDVGMERGRKNAIETGVSICCGEGAWREDRFLCLRQQHAGRACVVLGSGRWRSTFPHGADPVSAANSSTIGQRLITVHKSAHIVPSPFGLKQSQFSSSSCHIQGGSRHSHTVRTTKKADRRITTSAAQVQIDIGFSCSSPSRQDRQLEPGAQAPRR
jgi:hypothetical protein